MDQNRKWYRLDNQAKIFPEVYNKREPHTFRIQVTLKEKIDSEILQIAANNILNRYPMFKVKIRRGLFWVYLDQNNKPFFVQRMPYRICSLMDFSKNNDYMIKVFYRNNTIAVEVFHTLTDGMGLSEFVKSLTYEYLSLKGYEVTPDNIVKTTKERPRASESEDSSKLYYNEKNNKNVKEKEAFKLKGTELNHHDQKIISVILDTNEILTLSKQNNATATEYLVATMIHTIYKTHIQYRRQIKGHNHPIKIGVPVNLRKRFPSETMRNFVNIINVEVPIVNDDMTFEEILLQTQKEIKQKTTKEELTRIMSEYVSYERNILIRIVPSIIKKYILKVGYRLLGSSLISVSMSNIGKIDFPKSMEPHIKEMAFMVGASKNNPINIGIVTYKNRFKITLSSNIVETSVHKEFVRHFTNQQLSVEIQSNYVEEEYENVQ